MICYFNIYVMKMINHASYAITTVNNVSSGVYLTPELRLNNL